MNVKYPIPYDADRSIFAPFPVKPGEGWGGALNQ
jgi:hypothetical protein